MRRALGRMAPRVLVTGQLVGRARTLGCDQRFEGGQPVAVIGIAEVSITGGLCHPDLPGERLGPFSPAENAPLMQGQRHRKRLRLPRLAKHRTAIIPRLAAEMGRRVGHDSRSRYGSHASTDTLWPRV